MHTVTIPAVGESITEGILSRWLVADGARVDAQTPLFELETDKITTEVQAGASGIVHFKVKDGETLPIGAQVAVIEPAARTVPDDAPTPPVSTPPPSKSSAPAPQPEPQRNATLSPAVKKLIDDAKLDPNRIQGTGKDGLITKGDVLSHIDKQKVVEPKTPTAPAHPPSAEPAATKPSSPGVVRKRMSALRQKIAQRLVSAQHNAAILTTFNEIDMFACMDLRKRFKEEFEKKHGVGLGFMSFFTAAAVKALQKFPLINSQIDGNEVLTFDHIDIGVAVGTEKGLVVPVLRHVESMGFADIERAIRDYAGRAREGRLALEDMQGGTFTITNGGTYGSLMSTPIINPPQSGILGMHAIKERPIALNGQVVIRPMMYVALSYDHRLVDGSEAVSFLVRIKELIEAPEKLLLGL
jgi:2-oxoglutarate dehydrogenase E2 component (dihydrolipoamide succinyltransferase)